MDQYHLGEIAGQALSELEKLEAEVGQLAADNATLRKERDDARYQVAVLTRTLDTLHRTVQAFVAAEQKRRTAKADPWGYEEALAKSARKQG